MNNNFDLANIPQLASWEVNRVESNTDSLIAILPRLSDEQVESIHEMAAATYKASYRLQCATHAEVLARIKVRCAIEDDDAQTVTTAVAAASSKLGVSVSEFYKNARVHSLFFNSEEQSVRDMAGALADGSAGSTILEIASHSKDPARALTMLSQEKLSGSLTTRQAVEKVKEQDGETLYKPLLSVATSQMLSRFMIESVRSFPEFQIKTASSPEQGGGESRVYMVRFALGDLVLCHETAVFAGDVDKVVSGVLRKILQ